MVRRVGRAGGDVEEIGLVGRDGLGLAHPGDGLVGEICGQVIVGVGGGRNQIAVPVEDRVPVVHVAGVETVEVVEPKPVGPAVERARGAGLPSGGIVVLADPGGHVAVLAQDLADGAAAPGQDAGIAVVAGGGLGDPGERRRMVIAPGDQGRSRRTAERRGVEVVEPQPLGRQPGHGRRGNAAAESAELAEAGVVDEHQQDVRRAFGRLHRGGKLRRIGVGIGAAHLAGEAEVGTRQNLRCSRDRMGRRFGGHGCLLGLTTAGHAKASSRALSRASGETLDGTGQATLAALSLDCSPTRVIDVRRGGGERG